MLRAGGRKIGRDVDIVFQLCYYETDLLMFYTRIYLLFIELIEPEKKER